jgi:two-component system OmpR family response regulator
MEKLNALIVDDDAELRGLLSKFLEKNDFNVLQAENTKVAEEQLIKNPDVMLLDILMPGEDGITFCRRIRENFKKPIIMLTAVDDDIEQIVAHEVGADDYLTKPYNMRILLAKIKSTLRRYKITENISEHAIENTETGLAYQFLNWQVNTAKYEFTDPEGLMITLSPAEYSLLLAFIEHPNRVLSRELLLEFTQEEEPGVFDRSIDVLVSRLRNKVEADSRKPEIIKTIRGGGYLFTPKVTKQQVSL